jgi:hypothetical protein
MTTLSPNQGITLQAGTDPANLPGAQVAWDATMENRLAQRYASIADRTARNAAPNEGELSHLADVDRVEIFDSVNWISAYRRAHWAYIRKSADQFVSATTVLTNDTELLAAMPIAGTFSWESIIFCGSNDTADIQIAFTWPAGATVRWGSHGLATTAVAGVGDMHIDTETVSGNTNQHGCNGANLITAYGDIVMGGTAGNLQMQFTQNTNTVVNTTIQRGSRMRVWRTA